MCTTSLVRPLRNPRRRTATNSSRRLSRDPAGSTGPAGSGGEPLAALATTGRDDRAPRAGSHAQPEAVRTGPAAVVGLEGALALAHGRLSWSTAVLGRPSLIIIRVFRTVVLGARADQAPHPAHNWAHHGQHSTRIHGHGCCQRTWQGGGRRPVGTSATRDHPLARLRATGDLWQGPGVVSVPPPQLDPGGSPNRRLHGPRAFHAACPRTVLRTGVDKSGDDRPNPGCVIVRGDDRRGAQTGGRPTR
jgi:hypothetical protein